MNYQHHATESIWDRMHYMGIKCTECHISVAYYQAYFCFPTYLSSEATVLNGKYMVCEFNDRGFSITLQNFFKFSVSRCKMSPINLRTFMLTLYELTKGKRLV